MTESDMRSESDHNRTDRKSPPVLDTADGLERIMDDHELYGRMLSRFRKSYAAGVAPIYKALAAGDIEVAHRIVHTLKGASGMIGARAVHGQACALERALRTGSGAQARELSRLEPMMQALIDALGALQAGSGNPPAIGRGDPPDDPTLLAHLADLLREGDGAAVDVLEHSAASFVAVLGEPRYREVADAANEFNFAGALDALTREA